MERVNGIEPSYAAWEAAVLPLNYTRPDHARCCCKLYDRGRRTRPPGYSDRALRTTPGGKSQELPEFRVPHSGFLAACPSRFGAKLNKTLAPRGAASKRKRPALGSN